MNENSSEQELRPGSLARVTPSNHSAQVSAQQILRLGFGSEQPRPECIVEVRATQDGDGVEVSYRGRGGSVESRMFPVPYAPSFLRSPQPQTRVFIGRGETGNIAPPEPQGIGGMAVRARRHLLGTSWWDSLTPEQQSALRARVSLPNIQRTEIVSAQQCYLIITRIGTDRYSINIQDGALGSFRQPQDAPQPSRNGTFFAVVPTTDRAQPRSTSNPAPLSSQPSTPLQHERGSESPQEENPLKPLEPGKTVQLQVNKADRLVLVLDDPNSTEIAGWRIWIDFDPEGRQNSRISWRDRQNATQVCYIPLFPSATESCRIGRSEQGDIVVQRIKTATPPEANRIEATNDYMIVHMAPVTDEPEYVNVDIQRPPNAAGQSYWRMIASS